MPIAFPSYGRLFVFAPAFFILVDILAPPPHFSGGIYCQRAKYQHGGKKRWRSRR
jgi:hypothetical protein